VGSGRKGTQKKGKVLGWLDKPREIKGIERGRFRNFSKGQGLVQKGGKKTGKKKKSPRGKRVKAKFWKAKGARKTRGEVKK